MTKRKVKKIRDIQPERTPMPVQAPAERVRNFDEVATGYAETDALQEAERCLMCPKAHCVDACPVAIDIPGFIERILERDYRGAWDVISEANLMPAVCGRVCPQEDQCEIVCVTGKKSEPVAIGRLERYVADWEMAQGLRGVLLALVGGCAAPPHLPDPVAWLKEARITIQQIAWKNGLAETSDDWSCATFWYEPTPSAALPAMPDVKARTADIWKE